MVVIRAAALSVLAVLVVGVVGAMFESHVSTSFGESKADVARMTVKKYAYEAYPEWAAANPDRPCPELGELNLYMANKDTKDPWGAPYFFACTSPKHLRIVSAGEDGAFGTADDIRSDD